MNDFIESITRSLGRLNVVTPPALPDIAPTVARLVPADADLVALFRQRASDAKMKVIDTSLASITSTIAEQLRLRDSKTALLASSPLIERVGLAAGISATGVTVLRWSDSSLDASYDVDVGIGDVYRAVAETGSIVVRESAEQGRAVSLVPPTHFAIVEKSQIVPDLIDLLAGVQRDGSGSGIVIITGPSKTADIEMNLVTGVHGPGEVVIFLIDSE